MEIDVLEELSITASPARDIDNRLDDPDGVLDFTWRLVDAPDGADLAVRENGNIRENDLGVSIARSEDNITLSFETNERDITTRVEEGEEVDFRDPWVFSVTAQDNEEIRSDPPEVVTVRVRNLPPETNLAEYEREIDVGDRLRLDASESEDPDNPRVKSPEGWAWDLVQVPVSAGDRPQDAYVRGPVLSVPTAPGDEGTWIFRLRVTDNEGEEVEHEPPIVVVVDALPDAEISGPEASDWADRLTLSGAESVDPDSPPCTLEDPDCGHVRSDGDDIEDVSPGIVSYRWSLTEFPPEHLGELVPGPVGEVLGVNGSDVELSIPGVRLGLGTWVFQLEVEDGEGNTDTDVHAVEIIGLQVPPLAIAAGPRIYTLDAERRAPVPMRLDGRWSFDPDEVYDVLLRPPPRDVPPLAGLGITDYVWRPAPAFDRPACPFGLLRGPQPEAIPAGRQIPRECLGWWLYGLQVEDNDEPDHRTDETVQSLVISNCHELICIESPTTAYPAHVPFSDKTDVLISYYLDDAIYGRDWDRCPWGCTALLYLTNEDDPTVSYVAEDPNPVPTNFGGQTYFKWNGYVRDRDRGRWRRPSPGRYSSQIRLVEGRREIFSSPTMRQNILVQVAEPRIAEDSDIHLSRDAAEAGTDTLGISYEVGGGIPVTETNFRVYHAGRNAPLVERVGPPEARGVVEWDGRRADGTLVGPGWYEAEIEAIGPAGVLGRSPRHRFAVYEVDLEVNAIAEDDEEDPGITLQLHAGPVEVRVRLEPDGMPGSVVITEEGSSVLGPPGSDWSAGVEVPAGSANPEALRQLTVEDISPDPVVLVARYLAESDEENSDDRVVLHTVGVDMTAPCSADDREHDPGLFVQRRSPRLMGQVDFAREKFMMRRLDVRVSPGFDEVLLEQTDGHPASIALFTRQASAADPPDVAEIGFGEDGYRFPDEWVTDEGVLEAEIFVRSLDHGRVRLRLVALENGAETGRDEIVLRIGDPPGHVGRPYAAGFPHWDALPVVNAGDEVQIAIDPSIHDERRGLRGHVFVVERRNLDEWAQDNALVDAMTGRIEEIVVSDSPGAIVDNITSIWPGAGRAGAYDVVIDFGNCTENSEPDGRLDPEDLIMPLEPAPPSLVVLPDLTASGPKMTRDIEYGTDFEPIGCPLGALACPVTGAAAGPVGAACTPQENINGAVCAPLMYHCAAEEVCVDTLTAAGAPDGVSHCTRINADNHPLCAPNSHCVDSDADEVAHCSGPKPILIDIPIEYDGLAERPAAGGFRLRGRIVYPHPIGAERLPLVVMAHGRHTPVYIQLGRGRRWFELPPPQSRGNDQ